MSSPPTQRDYMAELLAESSKPKIPKTADVAPPTINEETSSGVKGTASSRFPEHADGKIVKLSWKDSAFGYRSNAVWKAKCQDNVMKVLRTSSPVKLMVGALESVGCNIDLSRHISCEHCSEKAGGGFDPINHQIVICQNTATTQNKVTAVLAHEMIHAYDYCRSTFDPKNIDHIACSEIRASALTHCSFISAWLQGDATPWNFKNRHRDCVRTKATESTMGAMGVEFEVALASVDKVFPKCYADLEPFGRIPRRSSRDFDKAYYERFYYGYG